MRLVALSRGAFTLIDDADWELVRGHTWYAHTTGVGLIYACTTLPGAKSKTCMHEILMRPPEGMTVDHIDGQTLDNRRANLRVCTISQNAHNRRKGQYKGRNCTSRFKGVTRFIYEGKAGTIIRWRSKIFHESKCHHLGTFDHEIEAARAYDTAAKQFFGPFARLNFPEQNVTPSNGLFFKPLESSECETNRSATEITGTAA